MNNASGWIIQLIPMNNLSTTQQIQLVTNGFSINGITIANSFFNIHTASSPLQHGVDTTPQRDRPWSPDYREVSTASQR
jgi:hypothetical protein